MVVIGIDKQCSISQHIFHLFPLIERKPAHQLIRNAFAAESFFINPALVVCTIEYSKIAVVVTFASLQLFNIISHPVGFIAFVIIVQQRNSIAGVIVGPQSLFELAAVLLDNRIRCFQNGLRRAIILFQWNLNRILIVVLKVQNIADICAPERIDALGVIADHAQVLIFLGQHICNLVLGMVGILIFINQDIFKAVLVLFKDLRMFRKELNGFDQKIIIVHRIIVLQALYILAIDFSGDIIQCTVNKLVLILVWMDELIFSIAYQPLDGTRSHFFRIVIIFFKQLFDRILRIIRIID